MKNESLKKFLAKNGQDAKKILNEKEDKGAEDDDLMKGFDRIAKGGYILRSYTTEPSKKLTVSDDPKWKGKLGKHDDCWK